jgi:hypothetical protein
MQERWDCVRSSFDVVDKLSREDARIILIGATSDTQRGNRETFNRECRDYCATHPKFHFIDVNSALPDDMRALDNNRHYSPAGYYMLAQQILALRNTENGEVPAELPAKKVRGERARRRAERRSERRGEDRWRRRSKLLHS